MRFHCLFRAATVFAAGGFLASATTLVAVWSPQKLVIGADSSVVTNLPNVLGCGCKISRDGESLYAFSGLVEDRLAGYNVQALAHEAVRSSPDLSIEVSHFVALARDPLARAVAAVKLDEPDQYAYLQQNHPVLQAIFADVEAGPPKLGLAGFTLAPDGSLIDFSRMITPGDSAPAKGIIYAGQQTHVKEYLNKHRDWSTDDEATLVRNLIQSEIDASDGVVGGPIDIISVEPNSTHWIQKKPECK